MLLVWVHWWSLNPNAIQLQGYTTSAECVTAMATQEQYYKDSHAVVASCVSMQDGQIYYRKGK